MHEISTMRAIWLCLTVLSFFGCGREPRESTPRERHEARVRRLLADRSTPLCRLPAAEDTSEWRRVPAPDALISFLLPASFIALPDSPPRFWHGGSTWRDGSREFVEFGANTGDRAPPGSCRSYLRGVPVAYITASPEGQPARVQAWLGGVGGLYDSHLVGTSPNPADRDLFLRVISTVRYDSGFFRRHRANADTVPAPRN
ncbi:MAG TPA: hypothetical protein VJ650_12230 [Gemmatimonadaceae bacterium]|nr:hypothetical protein [Gemmatimonadaceae bacterium]